MIDIIYLTFNRLEFTRKSIEALLANTDWKRVRKLIVYDDGSTDGTQDFLKSVNLPGRTDLIFERIGGPVAITNHYLSHSPAHVFAKIDNDAMMPPGWLEESLQLMTEHEDVGLLGLQAVCRPAVLGQHKRVCSPARHIGGIGLMRTSCFKTLPTYHGFGGRFGFTHWQWRNPQVVKAWIEPSVPMCLLDRMPFNPWLALSKQYVKRQWQRKVAPYTQEYSSLWEWWN